MLLLISDANILMDVEMGDLVAPMFSLGYQFAVPDVLYYEELEEQHAHLLDMGLPDPHVVVEERRACPDAEPDLCQAGAQRLVRTGAGRSREMSSADGRCCAETSSGNGASPGQGHGLAHLGDGARAAHHRDGGQGGTPQNAC